MSRLLRSILLISVTLFMVTGCGYNTLQSTDEASNAAWSDVLNQYKRRADLIPNLVSAVKGYTQHEEGVLLKVVEARAKATAITPSSISPQDQETFNKFERAQSEISSALPKVFALVESYPQLKADGNFRDLQAQIEGTENRITVARSRYIEAVRAYNITVRSFPSNLTAKIFGFRTKQNFTVEKENEISDPPKIDFTAK